MGGRGAIFSHLRKIAFPQALAEKIRERLYSLDPQDLREGKINRSGVGLNTQGVCYLFQEILIKHKICAFHVYSVPSQSGTCLTLFISQRLNWRDPGRAARRVERGDKAHQDGSGGDPDGVLPARVERNEA